MRMQHWQPSRGPLAEPHFPSRSAFPSPPPPAQRHHSRAKPKMSNATTVSVLKPANRQGSMVVEDFRISGPNIDLHVLPDNLKKDCVLFYCKETAPLAEKIRDASDGKVELGEISWK